MPSSEDRFLMLGGERFYTSARWLIVVLLFATSGLITQQPIWPPLQYANPVLNIIWAYAAFNLLATISLFVSPLRSIHRIAFLVDIAIMTLLTFFSQGTADLFYPLYFLPLIGAAVQVSGSMGLTLGLIAMVAYIAAFLGARIGPGNGTPPRDMLGLVALALRAAALVLIPWLAGGLAARSGLVNKQSVVLAEKKTEQASNEARAYRDRTRALYEVAYTLSTTMNYQSVLDVLLVESRKLVPYSAAMVLLSTGEQDELYIAASYGLNEVDKGKAIQVAHGRIGQSLRSGDPLLIADASKEPELQPIATLRDGRSACVVPLRAALRSYGVMVIASTRPHDFGEEQLGMLTALANYAIIALHNAQLVHDLRAERNKLISKEEEVRHQLARDLHDGPAQALAAITMNVEFVKRLLDRDPSRIPTELDKLGSLAKRTTHEIRTMLFELRPLVLETQGLDTTLRQYFERFQGSGPQIVLESAPITADLDTKTEGTLFNIVQESVNNAIKHAQAKHIWVRLNQTPSTLEAVVQDDGLGFDLKKVLASYEQRGSFGLLNIEERAKLIGGSAELHSAPGQGTTVRVVVPLN